MGKPWSDDELQILQFIRCSAEPVKTQLHHFPSRTQYGVEHQMRKLLKADGPKKRVSVSWVWGAAHSLLSAKPGMTAHEISRRIGCSYRQAMQVLYDNHAGADRCIYISGWEKRGVNQVPQWTIGKKPDALRLPLQTHEELLRKARLRHHKGRIRRGAYNPFASIVGLVAVPIGQPGRVIKHLHDDEYEEAA